MFLQHKFSRNSSVFGSPSAQSRESDISAIVANERGGDRQSRIRMSCGLPCSDELSPQRAVMLSDGFEFFDGVSVRYVVVFESLNALRPNFLDKAKAVLLLISRQLHIAVVTLFIDIVFMVAQV